MTPALIVNENFPQPAVRILREQGIDVLSVREAMCGASDDAILTKARETGRWLVTFDRDYGELVYANRASPPAAILYLRQEPIPPARVADWVLDLLSKPDQANGFLVVVGERTVRRRPLPKET